MFVTYEHDRLAWAVRAINLGKAYVGRNAPAHQIDYALAQTHFRTVIARLDVTIPAERLLWIAARRQLGWVYLYEALTADPARCVGLMEQAELQFQLVAAQLTLGRYAQHDRGA
jgi:hypothetical protein